jgi:hypothetical protein
VGPIVLDFRNSLGDALHADDYQNFDDSLKQKSEKKLRLLESNHLVPVSRSTSRFRYMLVLGYGKYTDTVFMLWQYSLLGQRNKC